MFEKSAFCLSKFILSEKYCCYEYPGNVSDNTSETWIASTEGIAVILAAVVGVAIIIVVVVVVVVLLRRRRSRSSRFQSSPLCNVNLSCLKMTMICY